MRSRAWLVAICVVTLSGCHDGGKRSALFAAGWTRELPLSAPRNYEVPGLSFVASGPRGDVAIGIGLRFCDAHGFWSADGTAWNKISQPPDAGRKLTGCAYMFGVTATERGFVAVGSRLSGSDKNGGVVWTSSNGNTWRIVDTGSTFLRRAVRSVASDGHLVVVSGGTLKMADRLTEAEVWYSTDDSRWTRVVLDPHAEVSAVSHGPHGWVAVGVRRPFDRLVDGGALVWRSADGRHWTRTERVAGEILWTVAAGPAGFIALGHAARRMEFLTSADGHAWTVTKPPGGDAPPFGAVVGNRFVAVGVAGYSYEGASHPQAAIWVLDHERWVRATLPKLVFSEPPTHGQIVGGFGQPMFGPGVATSDGSFLLVGGGQPAEVTIQRPSLGPRVWRWRPTS